MKHHRLCNDAIDILNNTCKRPNCINRHIAIIFLNRNIKRCVMGQKCCFYGINNITGKSCNPNHAEIDALKKLPLNRNRRLINIDIFVIRVSQTGVLGMSKPCIKCIRYMSKLKGYKVKNVYYSDKNGDEICETFTHLYYDKNHHIPTHSRLNNHKLKF
jgi:hypothetical protein